VRAAQQAGTVRTDVSATEVKGLIIGCQAMQTYDSESAERLVDVVLDGLRAPSGT
jgi:2-keto-3-deoxy-galactonokinase